MLNSLSQPILIFSSVVSVIYQSNKSCNEVLFVEVCLKHLKEKNISENMNEISFWKNTCMVKDLEQKSVIFLKEFDIKKLRNE